MPSPEQKLTVEVRVEPSIIQAVRLLHYNIVELENAIEQELNDNPALERVEIGSSEPEKHTMDVSRASFYRVDEEGYFDGVDFDMDPLSNAVYHTTLREYLSKELRAQLSEDLYPLADYLVDNLDSHGLLTHIDSDRASLETGYSPEQVEEVLRVMQSLEPLGIGARSVQECLLVQLKDLRERGKGHDLAERIVEEYWHLMRKPRIRSLARLLGAEMAAVQDALRFITKSLHPYPASRFRVPYGNDHISTDYPSKPDVIIRRTPVGFEVEIARPRWLLIVNPEWRKFFEQSKRQNTASAEEQEQIREYVQRAERYLHILELRYKTLRRITQVVIDQQVGFLETGSRTYLRPLTRSQVAQQLGIHESTVSRAISNKWVQLPNQELVYFADFFTPSLSIMEAIQEVLRSEDPVMPYTDEDIALQLYERWGIKASRRTVVKYRERLHIPSSRLRKERWIRKSLTA